MGIGKSDLRVLVLHSDEGVTLLKNLFRLHRRCDPRRAIFLRWTTDVTIDAAQSPLSRPQSNGAAHPRGYSYCARAGVDDRYTLSALNIRLKAIHVHKLKYVKVTIFCRLIVRITKVTGV